MRLKLSKSDLSGYVSMKIQLLLLQEGFYSLKVARNGHRYKIRAGSIKLDINLQV